MHHSRPQSEPPPSLLLVVAHGVGGAALAALRERHALPPFRVTLPRSKENVADLLAGPADAAPQLRDLGVAVDRRSLTLRARAERDEAVVAALSRRATGPAPATILELSSVVEIATAAGIQAAPAAIDRLGPLVASAAARVRAGDPTEVWWLGLGDLVRVHTTFDFARAFARSRLAPLAAELPLQIGLGCARLRPTSRAAFDLARELLTGPAFRRYGHLEASWDRGLSFVAGADVAFAPRRVSARPANPGEAELQALLPGSPRATEVALDLRGLIARFWLAAGRHAELRAAVPASARALDAAVDGVGSPLAEPAATPLRTR